MPRTLPWPANRLERDVVHELREHARRSGRTVTEVVTEAISEHLNRQLEKTTAA